MNNIRVDYYVTKQSSIPENSQLICTLIEKAYENNNSIYIHTTSSELQKLLDEQLWTFKDTSFIPHTIIDSPSKDDTSICIGDIEKYSKNCDIIFNLSNDVPTIPPNCLRILELVCGDNKITSRRNYKIYQQQGYKLHTHNV